MECSILNHYRNTTNEERYLALEAYRRGVATKEQTEVAWFALLSTVQSKATKHYNQRVTDGNEDRALLLLRYLEENKDRPVRLLLYRYRLRFPTFELLLELFGLPILDQDSLSTLVNKNKYYYMRQLAQLQREYNVYDAGRLTQLWLSEYTDGGKDVTSYRLESIQTMSEELMERRKGRREICTSQLRPEEIKRRGL